MTFSDVRKTYLFLMIIQVRLHHQNLREMLYIFNMREEQKTKLG